MHQHTFNAASLSSHTRRLLLGLTLAPLATLLACSAAVESGTDATDSDTDCPQCQPAPDDLIAGGSTGDDADGTTDALTDTDAPAEPDPEPDPEPEPEPEPEPDPTPCLPLAAPALTCGDGEAQPGELCFKQPVQYPIAPGLSGMALADITADGQLDLATASQLEHRVGVLKSLEDGSLEPLAATLISPLKEPVLQAAGPTALVAGDLFGLDPAADIITVNSYSNNWSVLQGTGDEPDVLEFVEILKLDASPRGALLERIDDNVRGDLVLTSAGIESARVDLFIDEEPWRTLELPGELTPDLITAAELDGDPVTRELVIANTAHSALAVIHIDPGSHVPALLGTTSPLSAGPPIAITAVDLDGDGLDSVVIAHAYSHCDLGDPPESCVPDRISVYDQLVVNAQPGGDHGSTLDATHQSYLAGLGVSRVVTGDINGDGALDVVAGNIVSADLTILVGDGDGGFAACEQRAHGQQPGALQLAVGDLNDDEVADIVTAHAVESIVQVALSWP